MTAPSATRQAVALRLRRGRRGRAGSSNAPGSHTTSTLLAREPGFPAAGERPLQELGGDQLVVAAYQDRHSPGGAKATGEVGHGISG